MSLDDLSAEEFVRTVDPSLGFCSHLQDLSFADSRIYKVESASTSYVLKAVSRAWRQKLVMLEGELLSLQKANDVPNITHLVRNYGSVGDKEDRETEDGGYLVILKEFAQGQLVREITDWTMALRRRYTQQLTRIVTALHAHGIAYLDLRDENIITSLDYQKITLIDFYCGGKDTPASRKQDIKKARNLFL